MQQDQQNLFLPDYLHYVAVEGVIGAGKTTFCRELARRSNNAQTVFEKADDNPFLPLFYSQGNTYAFQTQLWFLLSRYRQLSSDFNQRDLFYDITIADYLFAKDIIFANTILPKNELRLYNTVYQLLKPKVTQPDLVIYLQASTDVLLQRIKKRGIPYERHIDKNYIHTLNEAYNHFFFHFTETPLLIINTSDLEDFSNPYTIDELIEQIDYSRTGTNYYQPLPQKDIFKMEKNREEEESDNT